MTDEPVNAHAYEFRPNLWQRIAWWPRWPWQPKSVPLEQWVWGTQPYLVTVRENATVIGWHPVDRSEATTTIVSSRWACFAGIFRPPCYVVAIGRDPEWRAPEEAAP